MPDPNVQETKQIISKMELWCQKAREMLGAGIQGDSKKMKKAIDKVAKMLKEKSAQGGEVDQLIFAAAMDGFTELSKESERLIQEYEAAKERINNDPKLDKKAKEKAREALKNQAHEDSRAIGEQMRQLKDDMVLDEPLAKAVRAFMLMSDKSVKALEEAATQPNADTGQIKGAIRTIQAWQQQVNDPGYYKKPDPIDELRKELKPLVDKFLKGEKQSTSEKQKVDLREARAKPGASVALESARALHKELDAAGLLTPAMREKLVTGLKEADTLALTEQWIAVKARVALLPTRKQCQQAYLESRKTAQQDFGVEIAMVEKGVNALRPLLDAGSMELLLSQQKQLVAEVGVNGRSVKQITDSRLRFMTMIEELTRRYSTAADAQNKVTALFGQLSLKVKEHEPGVPLHQAQSNQRQFELVQSLRTDKRHADALDAAQALQAALDLQSLVDYQAWLQVEGAMRGNDLGNGLRVAHANLAAPPAMRELAKTLELRCDAAAVERLAVVRDWAALVAVHTEVSAFLKNSAGAVKQFNDFEGARLQANSDMLLQWGICSSALGKLTQALTKGGADPTRLVAGFNTKLDAIRRDWESKLANAGTPGELDAAGTKGRVAILLQQIGEAAKTGAVKDVANAQLESQGLAAFSKLVGELEAGDLGALAELNSSLAASFTQQITTLQANKSLDTDPASPWAQRQAGLQTLATQIEQAVRDAAQQCTDVNNVLRRDAGLLATRLTEAETALRKKLGGIRDIFVSRYKALFDALGNELKDLLALTETTNLSAANANRALLSALTERVNKLTDSIERSSSFEDTDKALESSRLAIAQLNSDGLATEAESTATALAEQLAALQTEVFGMEPGPAGVAITEMKQAIAAAQTELEGIKALRLRLKQESGAVALRIKTFEKQAFAETYCKSLASRLEAAKQKGVLPDQLSSALTEVGVLAAELTQLEKDPKVALARQKQLLADDHAQAKLKKEYTSQLEVFKSKSKPRAERAIKGANGDESQVAELDRMIKLAEKAASGGDFERALQRLAQAEMRVQQIERNPQGTALGDRKALPQHAAAYGAEINKLRSTLDDFLVKSAELVPDPALNKKVSAVLTPMVAKLKQQLNPRLFDLLVERLTNDKLEQAERREARAQALERLREARAFITSDPMMVQMGLNPIAPLEPVQRVLNSSLNRLEAHLRSAIR